MMYSVMLCTHADLLVGSPDAELVFTAGSEDSSLVFFYCAYTQTNWFLEMREMRF